MYRAKPSDDEETLYLSPQSRELLRQVLRVEKLDGESQLVGAVKEAMRIQYSRGFHEGLADRGKSDDLPDKPPPKWERRALPESPYRNSASSAERRKRRRQRRLRQRLRNALVTMVILVLAGARLPGLTAARPPLSSDHPPAPHPPPL